MSEQTARILADIERLADKCRAVLTDNNDADACALAARVLVGLPPLMAEPGAPLAENDPAPAPVDAPTAPAEDPAAPA